MISTICIVFLSGLDINIKVIEDKSGVKYKEFLNDLLKFIDKYLPGSNLMMDLKSLIPADDLNKSVKRVLFELPVFIKDEIKAV